MFQTVTSSQKPYKEFCNGILRGGLLEPRPHMSPMAYWAYFADLYDYVMHSAVLVDVLLALSDAMV